MSEEKKLAQQPKPKEPLRKSKSQPKRENFTQPPKPGTEKHPIKTPMPEPKPDDQN